MQSVYQFLYSCGFDDSARMLEEESHIPYEENALANKPALLLTALTAYENQSAAAFKIKTADPEFKEITEWIHTLRESPEQYPSYEWRKLETHTHNVICVKWQPLAGSHLYAAGSVDKTVAICDAEANTILRHVPVSGPVLSLHFNVAFPSLLLATCMNGGHSIVDVTKEVPAEAALLSRVDHKKYVVTGKWSPRGTHYITGSHDFTVNLYGPPPAVAQPASSSSSSSSSSDSAASSSAGASSSASSPAVSPARWVLLDSMEFASNVESVEWVDDTSFYVSVREDNYLHHVSIGAGGAGLKELSKINMNESGDDHVSFNVLDMALCPSAGRKSILLATDKHRVILMQKGTSHQIRNFYNIVNDGYSTPRLAWSPCGKYAYVTSQDKCVAVLDVASGQTTHRIEGHQINVRDVAMNPHSNKLITCSFDKTCRVWTPAVE